MKDMKQETGTEKKEDRRVRRTKKLLSQGLIELMQQKQVKDITVRELADLVDVNRGTFYLYYRDIFDMLERLEEELFEQLEEVTGKMEEKDTSLEESFALYQKGMELLKTCKDKIDRIEKKVQILDENGETHEF